MPTDFYRGSWQLRETEKYYLSIRAGLTGLSSCGPPYAFIVIWKISISAVWIFSASSERYLFSRSARSAAIIAISLFPTDASRAYVQCMYACIHRSHACVLLGCGLHTVCIFQYMYV